MARCTTVSLRKKEIINLCDGCRLGYATDFEINVCDGRITALIIPGGFRLLGFGKCEDLIIPWGCIECIGEDTILVKLNPDEHPFYPKGNEKRLK